MHNIRLYRNKDNDENQTSRVESSLGWVFMEIFTKQ